jgi:hypothetical protein
MEKKIKSKIEIKLTEIERDLLYFYLLGVYSLEDIETFEEYPAVVDKLEESITEVAKSTGRRRGVESNMEKLERVKPMALMGMMGEVAPQWVAKELNKIIDHLNSQDQEEEKYKILKEARLYPERTLGKLIKETLEDTPEQKEEWEEELGKLMSTWGKVLFVNKGRIGAGMQTAMYLKFYHFIKNLLSEREVFTKDELFTMEELAYLEEVMHLDYSLAVTFGQREKSDIGGGLLRKLSKLNKKK